MDASHLPVARSRVLARRGEGASAEGGDRRGRGRHSCQGLDVAEAEAFEVRDLQAAEAGDVAKGIAAGVAILGGVRHFADSNAIENDPDYSAKHDHSNVARGALATGARGGMASPDFSHPDGCNAR